MKNMFNSSTITGGSINFSDPAITKTDSFVCLTATLHYQTIYQEIKNQQIIIQTNLIKHYEQ